VLRIENVSKRYGEIQALRRASLQVADGEMAGIIGASGAGKSTLLRTVNRLVDPDSGSIRYHDANVTAMRGAALLDWRARCAMVFQHYNLVGRLDVLTNVLTGSLRRRNTLLSLLKIFPEQERRRAAAILGQLGLLPQALQRAETLSGGQQQRVAIGRALMQQPRILLADEPIASLDPANAAAVMDALRRVNRDSGITILCNLHTLEAARCYCSRIIGLSAGTVVFDGTPAELTEAAVREIYHGEASRAPETTAA
jgi:phosphonate transport system ATP-binding protein